MIILSNIFKIKLCGLLVSRYGFLLKNSDRTVEVKFSSIESMDKTSEFVAWMMNSEFWKKEKDIDGVSFAKERIRFIYCR